MFINVNEEGAFAFSNFIFLRAIGEVILMSNITEQAKKLKLRLQKF